MLHQATAAACGCVAALSEANALSTAAAPTRSDNPNGRNDGAVSQSAAVAWQSQAPPPATSPPQSEAVAAVSQLPPWLPPLLLVAQLADDSGVAR